MKGTMSTKNILSVIFILVLLTGAVLFAATFRTVPYGYVRVVTRFGALTGEVWDSGAHYKGILEKTEKIPVLMRSWEASDNPQDSEANYTDYAIGGQTLDGQQITITCTVLFSLPKSEVIPVLTRIGSYDMIVENIVKTYTRSVARKYAQYQYTASQLYGSGVLEYEQFVEDVLITSFASEGIVLEDFLVRKISFTEEYADAVEAKQIAEEGITTAKFNSQAAVYAAQQKVEMAKGDAEQQVLMAEARAKEVRLIADADAYAINVKGLALQKNPEMLQWEFVSRLSDVTWGILPGEDLNLYMPTSPR